MSKYNFNKKLETICNNKNKYVNLVQEYLVNFVNEYDNRLSKNYTVYVNLLDKLPIRDALQVKKYMASFGITYNVTKEGHKNFKFTKCELVGLWSDFERAKKEPSAYCFRDSLESFIKRAEKNNVDSKAISALKEILADWQ